MIIKKRDIRIFAYKTALHVDYDTLAVLVGKFVKICKIVHRSLRDGLSQTGMVTFESTAAPRLTSAASFSQDKL